MQSTTTTCRIESDEAVYQISLDANQLRARGVGDLITCEITYKEPRNGK